jgi:hypothetical protein
MAEEAGVMAEEAVAAEEETPHVWSHSHGPRGLHWHAYCCSDCGSLEMMRYEPGPVPLLPFDTAAAAEAALKTHIAERHGDHKEKDLRARIAQLEAEREEAEEKPNKPLDPNDPIKVVEHDWRTIAELEMLKRIEVEQRRGVRHEDGGWREHECCAGDGPASEDQTTPSGAGAGQE